MPDKILPPPSLPYEEVKARYFDAADWTNMHRFLHPTEMVGVIGRIANDLQIVTGDFVNTISTCMPHFPEVPEIHAVTSTESPSYTEKGFDGLLHEACLQLIGTGRLANKETQRWVRFAHRQDKTIRPTAGLNTVMEAVHSPALQLAKSINDVMEEQGFLYIEGLPQDDLRRSGVRSMLERNNYTIEGDILRGEITSMDGKKEEITLPVHTVSSKFKVGFIPGSGVDYIGNPTDYQFGLSVADGKEFKPVGWIVDPQGRALGENLMTHWTILNKIRSGGFYELDEQQQKMLFAGSFNVAQYAMGGFNGTRSVIAILEQEHGLDMSRSSLLKADEHGHSSVMVNIRNQLMNPKSSLPNELLMASAVAQALCAINPPDFEALRPVAGEGRNEGADVVGADGYSHIRPVHSFKYADYHLQADTLYQTAKVFGLELPDGTSLISKEDNKLIPPQVNTGREASLLLGYSIIAVEQAIIEQVLTRVLENNSSPCKEALQSIGNVIDDEEFADELIAIGKQISNRHNIQPFGLGRQHEICDQLTNIIRESLGSEKIGSLIENLLGNGEISTINIEEADKVRVPLKKLWIAADRIYALSDMPYADDGVGINAALLPVIKKLAPALLPELETESLGSSRRNAEHMGYTPRVRGRAVPPDGNTEIQGGNVGAVTTATTSRSTAQPGR